MAPATDPPKVNVPALLFGGLAGVFAILAAWLGVESFLLARNEHPITWYVRNQASWHPGITTLVVALAGFAVGSGVTHFVWDDSRHPK